MYKKFEKNIYLLLVVVVLFMVGCSKEDEKEVAATKDSAVVYLGTRSEPRMGFDPILGFANVDGVSIFHSNLIRLNMDLTIENEFAKEFSISEDGLIYNFKLRDDLLCSDGEKLTAKDVEFTLKKAGETGFVAGLDKIKEIKVINDFEIELSLEEPNSLFIYTICRLPIVPEHAYGENYGLNPIGSGPYKLLSWKKGQQMIVEKNANYFKGEPKLNRITFLFTNEEATLEAAKNGDLDLYNVPYNYVEVNIPNAELLSFKSVGKYCASLPCVPEGRIKEDGRAIGNNVTADPAIRKALNLVINRQDVVDKLMKGHGMPAYGLIDEDQPFYNPETAYKDNNVEEAAKILKEAGWVDIDNDGILEKNGIKAEFPFYASVKDKMMQDIGLMLSEQMKKVGLNPLYEVKAWEEIDKHSHDVVWLLNWGSVEPINIFYLYYGPNAGEGFYNSGYYENAKVDEYIEEAMKATSQEKANEFWKKAQWDGETGFSVRGDAAFLMLVNKNYLYRIKTGFDIGEQGHQPGTMGWCIARNIDEWSWK